MDTRLRGGDHDPRVSDDEQVFTAVEAFVAGLGRPYGVAAGVRQGTPGYLKALWVRSR
jgi:hypothetical protein